MTNLSFKLSRAINKGREDKGVPKSRAEILLALLRKRAEAHRQGLGEQEQQLRAQIKWSLPIQNGDGPPDAG